MSGRASAARRAELLARARGDRTRIARDLQPLAGAIGLIDRTWNGLRWMRERPFAIAAAVAAGSALSIYLRRRRGGLKLLKVALGAWQSWRVARRLLAGLRQEERRP